MMMCMLWGGLLYEYTYLPFPAMEQDVMNIITIPCTATNFTATIVGLLEG